MQQKEQKEILLDNPPNQEEYMVAQPKRKTASRRSSSRLSKRPVGRTEPQAIAGSAMTSPAASEPRDPGQGGQSCCQKADEPTAGRQGNDRATPCVCCEDPSAVTRMIRTKDSREQSTRSTCLGSIRPCRGLAQEREGPDKHLREHLYWCYLRMRLIT